MTDICQVTGETAVYRMAHKKAYSKMSPEIEICHVQIIMQQTTL